MKVFELAAELGIPSKQLLERMAGLGVQAKSHMSKLDDATVARLRAAASPPPAPSPEPPAEPVVPPVAVAEPEESEPLPVELPSVVLPEEDEEELALIEQYENQPTKEKIIRRSQAVREPERKTGSARPKPHRPPEPKPAPAARAPAPAPAPQPAPPPPAPAPVATPPPAAKPPEPPPAPASDKVLRLKGPVTVRELAERLAMKPNQVVAELMGMNILASITQRVDLNIVKTVAERHGFVLEHERRDHEHKPVQKKPVSEEVEMPDRPENMLPRPPVVTFLGHVDHGKTSLLDRIRQASVAAEEFGGITQHIGAYTKEIGGRSITFLDTPGHAAFTAMRARGANLTDIAVIVVAADDGLMPQTREAIQHAKAANVAIMVAVNKMDLPAASLDRVKQQLQAEGLAPEDWGGTTIVCPVSALRGDGIDHLLEMILLQAEMLDLKANTRRRATGYVIEARLEPGMGPTSTLLVTGGTLKIGDAVVCGPQWGRVRALINDHGAKVASAGPSTPVKCLGLAGVPDAGAEFKVCASEREARDQSAEAARKLRAAQTTPVARKASLTDLFKTIEDTKRVELKVILKTDVQGSIEAISHSLQEIKTDKVSLNILFHSTGNITVNDVMLASASGAVILGFHVAKEPGVDAASRREGVEIHLHNIIYEMIDQVRDAMAGLLAPELREKVLGRAEVLQVFQVGKSAKVAGCAVRSGSVRPRFKVRVRRGEEVLYQGSIASLKRFKDSVSEVKESQECGIRLENFNAVEAGDVLEFYEIEEIKQSL